MNAEELEAQRQIVTKIGNRLRSEHPSHEVLAQMRFPHWWQRRLRREWAEGYRLAYVHCENTVWHSMP